MTSEDYSDLYRSLFEDAADGIFISRNSCFTKVNASACSMTGYSKEELCGMQVTELVLTNGSPQRQVEREQGKTLITERQIKCKDGRLIDVEVSSRVLPNGMTHAIVRDITEKKEAEKRLRESEERFRLLVENSEDCVALTDPQGTIIYLSPSFCRITGYTIEEVLQLNAADFVHPKDLYKREKAMKEMQMNSGSPIFVSWRVKHKNGDWRWLEGIMINLMDNPAVGGIMTTFRDVTEAKLAESTILEKETHLRHAIEAGRMVIIDADLENDKVVFSDNIQEVMGIPAQEGKIGEALMSVVHPDDKELVAGAIRELMENGIVSDCQFRIIRPDNGKVVWIERRATVIRNAQGKAKRARGLFIDITERVEREEMACDVTSKLWEAKIELERNEKSLKEAQAVAHIGSWEAEAETLKTRWSEELFAIFGSSENEIEPSLAAFLSFVHPDDLPNVWPVIDHAIREHKEFSFFCQIIQKSGNVREIFARGRFEEGMDGKPKRLFGIVHDITDRKEAEKNLYWANQRLEISEKKLKDAQALAHVGSWDADFLSGKSNWSDESFRILGLEPGEIEPSQEAFASFIHPDDREEVCAIMNNSMKDFSEFKVSCRIVRKDGQIRRILSGARYVMSPDGRPVGLYGVMQDVTEMKALEENLKATNKDLETFIYKASHDLRGPLASISGLLKVCKTDITDPLALRYFNMIEPAVKKLDYTLSGLVTSMVIRETKTLNDPISFVDIISSLHEQFRHYDGYQRVKITSDVTTTDEIRSSYLIVQSIFQNLFENSIKYQNYNEPKPVLKISVTQQEKGIGIRFEDNGIGISDEVKDKVFDMYFRGTQNASGSGLGLYLVKSGIDRLGGKIHLESQHGKGSVFSIFLPFSQHFTCVKKVQNLTKV